MYTFDENTTENRFKELLQLYEDFKENNTSTINAKELSIKSWHLTDSVFQEFPLIHLMTNLGSFRRTLNCSALNIMHDIATEAKHFKVSRPKSSIVDTIKHISAFLSIFSNEFDQSHLEIEL